MPLPKNRETSGSRGAYTKLQLVCEEWSVQVYQNRDDPRVGYIAVHIFPDFIDGFEGLTFKVALAKVHIFQGTVFAGRSEGKFHFPAVILNAQQSLYLGVCWY